MLLYALDVAIKIDNMLILYLLDIDLQLARHILSSPLKLHRD